ncbi:hypothetical protein MHB54_28045 [Paenibacillus sp. FSL M7-0802]|uniref:hypothetical protein n=1 Tax=Paenibacillus sp. FSL M7-0802 TaxID=2921536 RepID=UPI0030FAF509
MDNKNELDISIVLGYVSLACQKIGYSDNKTKQLINVIKHISSEVAGEQAKLHYEQNDFLNNRNNKGNPMYNEKLFEHNIRKKFYPHGASSKQQEVLKEFNAALKQAYQAGYEKAGYLGYQEFSVEGMLGLIITGMKDHNRSDKQIVKTLFDVIDVIEHVSIEKAIDTYENSDYRIDLKRMLAKQQ